MIRKKNSDYIEEFKAAKNRLVSALTRKHSERPDDTLIKAAKGYMECFDKVKDEKALPIDREDFILYCSAMNFAKEA